MQQQSVCAFFWPFAYLLGGKSIRHNQSINEGKETKKTRPQECVFSLQDKTTTRDDSKKKIGEGAGVRGGKEEKKRVVACIR